MKQVLERNEREILRMQQEKDRIAGKTTGHLTTDDLMRKIRERDAEARDLTKQFEEIHLDFQKKEKIFQDSRAYMEEVNKQISDAKLSNYTLQQQNMRLHMQFSQAKSLKDQLRDLD